MSHSSQTHVPSMPMFLAQRAMRRIVIAVRANEVPATRDVYLVSQFMQEAERRQTGPQK